MLSALSELNAPIDKNLSKKDVVAAAYEVLILTREDWKQVTEPMRVYSNPKYGAIYTELRNRLRHPKRLRQDVEETRARLAARSDSEEEDSVSVKSSTLSDQSVEEVIDTTKPDGKGIAKQEPSCHDGSDEEEVNEKSVSFRTPVDDRDELDRSHPLWAALAREDCPFRQVRSKYK